MCGEIVAQRGRSICKDCAPILKPIKGVRCYRCFQHHLLEGTTGIFAMTVVEKKHVYQQGIAVFGYQSPVATVPLSVKISCEKRVWNFLWAYAASVCKKRQIQALED